MYTWPDCPSLYILEDRQHLGAGIDVAVSNKDVSIITLERAPENLKLSEMAPHQTAQIYVLVRISITGAVPPTA